jgi:hypothetical protein
LRRAVSARESPKTSWDKPISGAAARPKICPGATVQESFVLNTEVSARGAAAALIRIINDGYAGTWAATPYPLVAAAPGPALYVTVLHKENTLLCVPDLCSSTTIRRS